MPTMVVSEATSTGDKVRALGLWVKNTALSMPMPPMNAAASTAKGGYSFTSPRRRFSVFVADDPARHSTFTSPELLGYLRAFTALAELNQLVIDMWLTRAAMRGEVLEATGGGWRLAR